jgi:hypothetical protein
VESVNAESPTLTGVMPEPDTKRTTRRWVAVWYRPGVSVSYVSLPLNVIDDSREEALAYAKEHPTL